MDATTQRARFLIFEVEFPMPQKLAFVFVGPTPVYSLVQATGVVNDHLAGCLVRDDVEQARQAVSVG